MTTISAGAVPVIEVACPHGTVTQLEHLIDLDNQEGRCIHWLAETEGDGLGSGPRPPPLSMVASTRLPRPTVPLAGIQTPTCL